MCIGDSMHAADIAGKSSRLIHQTEPAACRVPFLDGLGPGPVVPGGRPARAHGTVVGGLAGTAVTRRGAGRARSGWGAVMGIAHRLSAAGVAAPLAWRAAWLCCQAPDQRGERLQPDESQNSPVLGNCQARELSLTGLVSAG
jgi:hypothetical protein